MKRYVILFAIMALMVGLLAAPAGAGSKAAQPELSGPHVGVIVHTAKPYEKVVQAIEEFGGTVTIQYENVDGLAAQIPVVALGALAQVRGVDRIERDTVVQLPAGVETELTARELPKGDGELINTADLGGFAPDLYYSYLSGVTGAQDTWDDANYGSESLVAVIDTGTDASHGCLEGRVIKGPDFSTDQGSAYEGSTLSTNHYHGTFVGGVIASSCAIGVPGSVPLGQVLMQDLPSNAWFDDNGTVVVPLLGMAPASEIYAVKVFPHTGAGAANSIIEQAIDHVISKKLSGELDIDVLNMSLGGGALFDGSTLEEQLIDAATAAGITVVVSAGNEGPAPNSGGSPGTADTALTVGAASDPVHTRIYWDYFADFGQGIAMYPTEEIRVSDFSGRGPTGDGRAEPDVLATGVMNFSLFPGNRFGWGSGTSFSAPTVAGEAALLNSWAEVNNPKIGPDQIRNAIKSGAVSIGDEWSYAAQGSGYVNVPNALALLESGHVRNGLNLRHDQLQPNTMLGSSNTVTETVTLGPARTHDWVFEVDENTTEVRVDVDVDGTIDPGPGAIPNSFELYVKSAKRGGTDYIIDSANVFGDGWVTVGDSAVDWSAAVHPFACNGFDLGGGELTPADCPNWPMEPGLMKVTLEGDWTNNADALTATVTITRTQKPRSSNAGGITLTSGQDDFGVFAVTIPDGTTQVQFDLAWKHNWSLFPTNDLDLLFVSPNSYPFFDFRYLDGATLNSPERQIIMDPEPGTWYVLVNGYAVWHGRDPYVLTVHFEND